jgi:hypothetical protein
MINKLTLLIFLFLVGVPALACEVHLPDHLVILGNSSHFTQSLKHNDCSDLTLEEINQTLQAVEGKITSFQFEEILKSKDHTVLIHPKLIQVQHLKHLVRDQLMLPTGIQLRSSEAVNSANYLAIAPGDKVQVECLGCLFGSQQPLNVKVLGFDGSNKSLTVKADFKKMVRAYRVLGFHPAFSEITSSSLKQEYVESIPHTDLITNLDTLKFFKLNKPVKNGELLRQSDLNSLNLVRAGVSTEVIIENKHVRLKTQGISRSSGSLGDFVEVFHPQKKKKYLGKVIDVNKVLVEL